jgi:hypothetical protein
MGLDYVPERHDGYAWLYLPSPEHLEQTPQSRRGLIRFTIGNMGQDESGHKLVADEQMPGVKNCGLLGN